MADHSLIRQPMMLRCVMMAFLLFLLLNIPPVCCGLFDAAVPVKSLSDETFSSTVNRPHSLTLTLFYSPKSGKSKTIAPEFAKIAKQFAPIMNVTVVDCISYESVCDGADIALEEIPQIKLFGVAPPKRYSGPPNYKTIAAFVAAAMPSHVITLNSKTPPQKSTPRAVLFTDKAETPNMYKALSHVFNKRIVMAECRHTEKAMVKRYNITHFPTLIFLSAATASPVVYDGKLDVPTLSAWFESQLTLIGADATLLPAIADESCLQRHCVEHGSLCAILIPPTADAPTHVRHFEDLIAARPESAVFKFSYLSTSQPLVMEWALTTFAVSSADYPQIVVFAPKKRRWALYRGGWSDAGINEWLNDVMTGRERTAPIETAELTKIKSETELCPPPPPPRTDTKTREKASSSSSPSDVGRPVALSISNFDRTVLSSSSAWIVLFTPHSVGDVYETVSDFAKKSGGVVRVGVVSDDTMIRQLYKVEGDAPIIRYFVAGAAKTPENFLTFTGAATADALTTFARTLNPTSRIRHARDEAEMQQFLAVRTANTKAHIILFPSKPSRTAPALFAALSWTFPHKVEFALASSGDESLKRQLNVVSLPAVFALTPRTRSDGAVEVEAMKFEGAMTFEHINNFIQAVLDRDNTQRTAPPPPSPPSPSPPSPPAEDVDDASPHSGCDDDSPAGDDSGTCSA